MALDEASPNGWVVLVRSIVINLPPVIFMFLRSLKYLTVESPGVAMNSPPGISLSSFSLKNSGIMNSGIMIEEFKVATAQFWCLLYIAAAMII